MSYQSIDPKSIQKLPKLKSAVEKSKHEYAETKIKFMRPYCVAYLDQVMRSIRKEKEINLMPWNRSVHQYLDQCGFEFLHGNCSIDKKFDEEIIIPLNRFEDCTDLEEKVVDWIRDKVLGFIPNLTRELKKHIVRNLWEIVQNGIVHGIGEFGVSACGQLYPKKGYFEIAFYDAGVGLAMKIKDFGAVDKSEPDHNCIKWALQQGASTLETPSSGMGLFYLRKFIRLNQGAFQFISGTGYFGNIDSQFDTGITLDEYLEGTLVNIRIVYNDNNL